MSDRFKFRVWINDLGQFADGVDVYHDGSFNMWLHYDCGENMIQPDKSDILMQCTGLRDKSGKLIFEGDIVKTRGDWNNGVSEDWCCSCKSSVTYEDGRYWTDSGLDDWYEGCEIIGNIHESPELLD